MLNPKQSISDRALIVDEVIQRLLYADETYLIRLLELNKEIEFKSPSKNLNKSEYEK